MENNTEARWLIYGANGYTGKLIAQEAARRELNPVLAGRNRPAVQTLGAELGLDTRIFAIESVEQVAAALDGIDLVLNCAGPFAPTADTVVQACIGKGVHYLDISGEPDMFERHLARRSEAAASGSVVVPGVGFDVVPSDTLARLLADRMGNAVSLEMAFFGSGAGSAGSAKTVLGMMADKCKVRRNGKIVRKPLAFARKRIRFSDREEWCMSIPWGDIATAYHSTGIPNITMYMAASRTSAIVMRLLSPFAGLLALPAMRRKMFARIEESMQGPDSTTREQSCMRLWGEVCDPSGKCLQATLDTLEGFTFTIHASLLCVERVMAGGVSGGCYTPTQAFGTALVFEIPGTEMHWQE